MFLLARKVKVDDLASAIINELEEYNQDVTDGLKDDIRTVSKECAKEIRQNAPKDSGEYAKGWKTKTAYESRNDIRITVYNSKKPQLGHLLENGHVLKGKNGKVLGTVGAKPHIRPAEQNAEKKLMKKVKVTVRGGGS